MARQAGGHGRAGADVDAVTEAVLTASRLLVAVSARAVAAVDDSLTLPQFRMLVVLSERGPLKLVTIADLLGVNPSTVSRMVDRLVVVELVGRQPNPRSRRESVISLTEQGETVVTEVTALRRREIARIVQEMRAPARQGLVDALTEFVQASGERSVLGPPSDAPDAHWP